MRILVTGGVGYIGSHTLIELAPCVHDILVVDNLSNGSIKALHNVRQLTGQSFDFIKADIRERHSLMKIFKDFRPDAVIHFAGAKAVNESVQNPLKYYDNNVTGSVNVLSAMDAVQCKKIVFSSSATVYGAPHYLPYDEDHPVCSVNPYGQTKLIVETILKDWTQTDTNRYAVSLRYFNPVGAHSSGCIGEEPKGIPNNLMPYITKVAARYLDKLQVFGGDYDTPDGTSQRDYIHVMDVAKAHVRALDYGARKNGFSFFNIGTGQARSVLEMIKIFETVSGKQIPYDIVGRRTGDLPAFWADPVRACKALDWRAEKTIEDMCRDAWNWQIKNPDGYN